MNLELHSLTTGYRSGKECKPITPDINATLRAGELTCLLGPNGAGKSTLLKTLATFIPPLSGSITLGGEPLSDLPPARRAKLLGVVLTDRIDAENMTVRQLVAMGRAPYTGFWGNLSDEDNEAVEEALSLVGINDLAERTVATLSDGERQKAMTAKALAQQTPVILLDEPTAFLDFPSKVETMLLLRRLASERGLAVLISTHDVEITLQTADRLWLMPSRKGGLPSGKGLIDGTPAALSEDGSIAALFNSAGLVYDPGSMNFLINLD